MRPARKISYTALLLLVVASAACGDVAAPPAAQELAARPVLSAVQEKGVGAFVASGTLYWACVGEFVFIENAYPFAFHRTTTPSGNTILSDHFIHGAET